MNELIINERTLLGRHCFHNSELGEQTLITNCSAALLEMVELLCGKYWPSIMEAVHKRIENDSEGLQIDLL